MFSSSQVQALLPLFFIILCALALKRYLNIGRKNPQGLPPPPGPKPWPVIGSLFDAPRIDPWVTFQKWGNIYGLFQIILSISLFDRRPPEGGIVSFRVFSQTFVVINSREIAFELLEKRARIYSDRPDIPLLDISGWDWNLVTMRYGPKWRAHRRIFGEKFKEEAAVS